jgi:hypothetical protein
MPSDIERLERKMDMILALLLRIAPVDLSKQEQWLKEVEDLKAGRRIRRNGDQNHK